MNEIVFQRLRFNRVDVPKEESGNKPFHYYEMEIGDVTLMGVYKNKEWVCQLFDSDRICIYDERDLNDLLKILIRNIKRI